MEKIAISLMCLFIPLAAGALAGGRQTMEQAAELYGQGERERAIRLWEELRREGYASPALFYNLGTAYLESEEPGKAVLNLERALLLQPGRQEVRHNLRLAMEQVEGDPLPWSEDGWVRRWRSLRGSLSSNAWAALGLAGCWAAALGAWQSRRKTKRWPWVSLFAGGLAVAAIAWSLSYSASRAFESSYAVVTVDRLAVRVGPDEQSGETAVVFEGWKVQRTDRIGNWIKVGLPDGQEGWVQESGLEGL